MSKLIASKYGYLMLPRAFTDKVTPDIDLTDETVFQCDATIVKVLS